MKKFGARVPNMCQFLAAWGQKICHILIFGTYDISGTTIKVLVNVEGKLHQKRHFTSVQVLAITPNPRQLSLQKYKDQINVSILHLFSYGYRFSKK